jgi:zinc protease
MRPNAHRRPIASPDRLAQSKVLSMAKLAPSRSLLLILAITMLAFLQTNHVARAAPRASESRLANGMRVVVVPDHRAPVVTHMVWYEVGAADEPRGVSGIAHFLEHLMFKSTDKIPMGEFSKIVARLGGQDNAFTGHDATSYFQRIAKERLGEVMGMEADRMVNLRLTENEVLTERNVILEERRSRIDNSPNAMLDEQMDAVLYLNHPYHIPIIGWEREMAKLSQHDALSFYKHYYAPNNAILIVTGDVTMDEVMRLAESTYGKIPSNPQVTGRRDRPGEPPHIAPRRVDLTDPRAGQASLARYYYVPSYSTAPVGDAEALEVLMKIAASSGSSRLYKKLVVEQQLAATLSGWYSGSGRDSGKIAISAIAAEGVDLGKLEKALDTAIDELRKGGVTEAELQRAKASLVADYVYESDSQATLARRYGWALTAGRTLADVEAWPDAIAKVTANDVKRVAGTYLELRQSVTGTLMPGPADSAQAVPGGAKPAQASPAAKSKS